MKPMEEEMRLYELGYRLRGDMGDEKALEASELVRKTIEEEQGVIASENKPQKKSLGYPIQKQTYAYFGFSKFVLAAEKITSLKKNLEKLDLLRILINQTKNEGEAAVKRSFRKSGNNPSACSGLP